MADEGTATVDEPTQVRTWRLEELRRLGFPLRQRAVLLERIEDGELELQQVRHLIDDLEATPEQAWWVVS